MNTYEENEILLLSGYNPTPVRVKFIRYSSIDNNAVIIELLEPTDPFLIWKGRRLTVHHSYIQKLPPL